MAVVTRLTDRLDTFARAHLGSFSETYRKRLIAWNLDYFVGNPCIWLRVGQSLRLNDPTDPRFRNDPDDIRWVAEEEEELALNPPSRRR